MQPDTRTTFTKKRYPIMALAIASTFIAGCGGGGGGSSTPSVPSEALTVNAAENSTSTVNFRGDLSGSVNAFMDPPEVSLSLDEDAGEATITVADVERADVAARYEFTTSANIRYIVAVTVTNTSAEAVVAQATSLTEITSASDLVRDDLRLAEIALELEYLAAQTTYGDKEAAKAANVSSVNAASTNLTTSISTLRQALTNYNAGDITETQLEQTLSAANTNFAALDAAAGDVIDDVLPTINALLVADLPGDINQTYPLEYVPEADRFSRYMRDNFGTLEENGDFSFSADYDFLNSAFTFASNPF